MDYKEKFQLAKDWYTDCTTTQEEKELLERLLPELKESEDERIRKELKSFFDSEISDYGNVEWRNGIRYGEIVAWLEKQGEQKPAWSEEEIEMINLLISILEINHPEEYFKSTDKDDVNMRAVPAKKIINWLKSLKGRVQPKQKWSEEDERVIIAIKEAVSYYWSDDSQAKTDILAWIEQQKEQKSTKWSNEDKEVDLDKSLTSFMSRYAYENDDKYPSAIDIAKHFFELGIAISNKTQERINKDAMDDKN